MRPCKRGSIALRDKYGNCMCEACLLFRRQSNSRCGKIRTSKEESKAKARKKAKEKMRNDPRISLLLAAKVRARKFNVPFNLKLEDIIVPSHCPVLGIELKRGEGKAMPSSPSLDRIIPSLGYVPNNICVISNKANTIKNDASLQELEMLTSWLREKLKENTSV